VPALVQAQGQVFAPLPEGLSSMGWSDLETAVKACQSCGLCAARQTPILGTGQGTARWMVVGDLPTETDEQQGQPFTGPEGVLLDNMLKAVGVRRQGSPGPADASADSPEACLTHAVKCRPLNGRNPETAELATCAGYLSRQVALAQPRVILAMGRFAIQSLLGSTEPMGKLRGRLHDFQGVPVVVTYPPSSLLRNPADKAKAWADLVLALSVSQS
jgi:DNA polymerase